jgi:sugar (pentulose or hexulose) kinase
MNGAVAIDMGATSARFAAGTLQDGRIEFRTIKQVQHMPRERDGTLYWNLPQLLGFCRDAAEYARVTFDEATIGIDSWGVDHGFIDPSGRLVQDPVCYRDLSHVRAFESLEPFRRELYELTGCQHQPFNTICQLIARKAESPSLVDCRWLILPDLLAHLLSGEDHYELTQASTTQLLGLDNRWCARTFEIAGWPVPEIEPSLPGRMGREIEFGVQLAHVGSHDTASAVLGFGDLRPDQLFLNVGTWSLIGTILDQPLVTHAAEEQGYTNERTVDGRVRLLKNIPGFYVINRLHDELGIKVSVPDWLAAAEWVQERVNLLHPDLYNPESMVKTCAALAGRTPRNDGQWAALALSSLTHTIAKAPAELEALTGRRFKELRVGGGGSQSAAFCRSLARESGLRVVSGPVEATVLGNLALQFLAKGALASWQEMADTVQRSSEVQIFMP